MFEKANGVAQLVSSSENTHLQNSAASLPHVKELNRKHELYAENNKAAKSKHLIKITLIMYIFLLKSDF